MNRRLIFLFIYLLFAASLTFGQEPKVPLSERGIDSAEIKDDIHINIELFGGGQLYSFPTEFEGVYSSGNKFDQSFSPSVGISFLYMIPELNRFGLGVSLAYNQYKSNLQISDSTFTTISPNFYYSRKFNESITIENTLLRLDFSFLYFINPAERIKFFARVGLLNNITLGGSKKIISEYSSTTNGIMNGSTPYTLSESGSKELIELSKSWTTIVTGLGIKIGKSRLDFNYSIPSDLHSDTSRDKRFRIVSYGFNYYYCLN